MTNNKIYVGNLSFNTTKEDLEVEFSKHGELDEVKLISDMDTGRSKGFAFITYQKSEDAKAALVKNGEEMAGRALRVNPAEERKSRSDRDYSKGSFNRGSGSGSRYESKKY